MSMASKPPQTEFVSTRSLMDKLGVMPFSKISVIGIDDADFWALLNDRASDVAKGRLRKNSDLIFFAADRLLELQKLPA